MEQKKSCFPLQRREKRREEQTPDRPEMSQKHAETKKRKKKLFAFFFLWRKKVKEKKCMMRDKIFLVRFSRTIISPHNTTLKTRICVPFYRSRWGRVLARHRRLLRKRLPLLLNLVLSLVFGDVIRRLLIIELEFHHREVREDNGEHQTSSFVALYPRPQRRRRKKITTIWTSTRSWTIWKVQRKKTSTKF